MQNIKIDHIEDLLIKEGSVGLEHCIDILTNIIHNTSGYNITTKWDGAPSIVCGINPENGRLFVGTKSVFNKKTPKICYSSDDIRTYYYDNPYLRDCLNVALFYLPRLNIKTVLQGEVMFIAGDRKYRDLNKNGEYHIHILLKPNTITYAIPYRSNLGRKIEQAEIGIVFHTEYTGNKLSEMVPHYNPNVSKLNPNNSIWFRDASFTPTNPFCSTDITQAEFLLGCISSAPISKQFLNALATNKRLQSILLQYINNNIREGNGYDDGSFETFIHTKISEEVHGLKKIDAITRKAQEKEQILDFFFKKYGNDLKVLFHVMELIHVIKTIILDNFADGNHFDTYIEEDGLQKTQPEGYVCVTPDNKIVKLVDRKTFSHHNFNIEKDWQ